MMEQDWEYIAGRNQASRQYHKSKRKEAELKLATLRAELERERAYYDKLHDSTISLRSDNERLREALDRICNVHNPFVTNADADFMNDIAKEALK